MWRRLLSIHLFICVSCFITFIPCSCNNWLVFLHFLFSGLAVFGLTVEVGERPSPAQVWGWTLRWPRRHSCDPHSRRSPEGEALCPAASACSKALQTHGRTTEPPPSSASRSLKYSETRRSALSPRGRVERSVRQKTDSPSLNSLTTLATYGLSSSSPSIRMCWPVLMTVVLGRPSTLMANELKHKQTQKRRFDFRGKHWKYTIKYKYGVQQHMKVLNPNKLQLII